MRLSDIDHLCPLPLLERERAENAHLSTDITSYYRPARPLTNQQAEPGRVPTCLTNGRIA